MGLSNVLRLFRDPLLADSETDATADLYMLPSWQAGDKAQAASLPPSIAEAFGISSSSERVTRKDAMRVPAVRRGRNIIAGTLGAAPLVATRNRANNDPERVTRQILIQPDPSVTPAFTLTWTIDDLIFYGVSWWKVLEFGSDNFPSRAERVHPSRLRIDTVNNAVYVDGKKMKDREVIRFDGPDEGVLEYGSTAIKTYLLLDSAVRNYARLDIPLGVLEDQDGSLSPTEVTELLDSWEAARAARSTGYLPQGLKYVNPNFNPQQLELGTARGFQAQEIARLMNLPASYINAPTNDSLTYATTESNRRELVDMTLSMFMAPIEQRLSMPDVTPLGTTVRFDLGKFLRGDIKSVVETGAVAVNAQLMTEDEVRTEWLGLPPKGNTDE